MLPEHGLAGEKESPSPLVLDPLGVFLYCFSDAFVQASRPTSPSRTSAPAAPLPRWVHDHTIAGLGWPGFASNAWNQDLPGHPKPGTIVTLQPETKR